MVGALLREQKETIRTTTLLAVYLLLSTLTWSVFGQTLRHSFVAYDDPDYVYENPEIIAGITQDGIVAAFAHPHARNWHPLTTISHMLDCELYGLNASGHHLTNVLLHMGAVLLLFSALRAMTGRQWRSAFVAAVFAIHPLRAESVAWVAERKDVLSALFFMITLGAYIHYARHPSLKRYFWVAAFFAFGLMSKPMLITAPLLLLLLDYWPLGRWQEAEPAPPKDFLLILRRLIIEKIPLILLSICSAMATIFAQRSTIRYGESLPFIWRVTNALVSYVAYMGQMFWPAKLAVFYPHHADSLLFWQLACALLLIIGVTLVVIALCKTRPYLMVGWFWYLICLLPVIGLIPVGLGARADRYTYLPQIGLYIALTWAAADVSGLLKKRPGIYGAVAALIIVVLAWRAWIQTSFWRDTESLWNHALAVTPDNDVAHYNVAALLLRRGRLDEAIWHYEQALHLGSSGRETHHYHLSRAILHNALGNAFAQKGLLDEAIIHYRAAIGLQDDFADAHSNLASVLAQNGQTAEAIAEYQKALAFPPEDAPAHLRLAAVLEKAGRDEEAITHCRRALDIAPTSIAALNALARILATRPHAAMKNNQEAIALAEKAKELSGGKNAEVLRTLAVSYAESGRSLEAASAAQDAARLAEKQAVVEDLHPEIKVPPRQ
jgi:protein O-mannosyl-transferase